MNRLTALASLVAVNFGIAAAAFMEPLAASYMPAIAGAVYLAVALMLCSDAGERGASPVLALLVIAGVAGVLASVVPGGFVVLFALAETLVVGSVIALIRDGGLRANFF